MKKVLLGILLLVVIFITIVAYKAIATPQPPQSKNNGEAKQLKGFQLSPKSFSPGDFQNFFEQNKSMGGNIVGWSGAIADVSRSTGAPETVMKLTKNYAYTPIISIQVYDRKTNKLFAAYTEKKSEVISFIGKHKPAYFGIGIEMNLLYDNNKQEYANFIRILSEYVQDIAQVSPNTKIITSMQYEQLLGYRGGLFGGKNDTSTPSWFAVSQLPKNVILGLTTYPTLIFKDPKEIPGSYYSQSLNKTDRSIIFTEMGWLDSNSIKGWESSPDEQNEFLGIVTKQTNNDRILGYIWSFMYTQSGAVAPFDHMSLQPNETSSAILMWKSLGN